MVVKEFQSEEYSICYDPETMTLICTGSLRLNGMEEYAPLVAILDEILEKEPSLLTLNLRDLEFLNSSGINILSKFVLSVRQKNVIQMIVQGSNENPWHRKSLKNLQRLMPSLQLELE